MKTIDFYYTTSGKLVPNPEDFRVDYCGRVWLVVPDCMYENTSEVQAFDVSWCVSTGLDRMPL